VALDSRLVIPVNAAESDKIRYSRYASRYKVHTGDTVLTVAEDFGVPPESLRRWNHLKGNDLHHGRLLTVYKPLGPGEADKAPIHHRKKKPSVAAAKKKPAAAPRKESLSARTP
jgi:LysM repeat protein